jgi:hypothetical protein
MFLQTDMRHTPFSALHLFFPTLPIICAQVAAKRFFAKFKMVALKKKKNAQHPNIRAIPIV